MTRLSTIWQALTRRLPQATTPRPAADPLDAQTDRTQHDLQVRWWYWRHYFLEAKRRTIAIRHDQTDT